MVYNTNETTTLLSSLDKQLKKDFWRLTWEQRLQRNKMQRDMDNVQRILCGDTHNLMSNNSQDSPKLEYQCQTFT